MNQLPTVKTKKRNSAPKPRNLAERYEWMRVDVEMLNGVMVRTGSCPYRLVKYGEKDIPIYDIHGRNYLAAIDIGQILGFRNPEDSIRLIYNRHRDELEKHCTRIKVIREQSGGEKPKEIRVFSEAGCNLISMFSKTENAKNVRAWLADLPNYHRETMEILKSQLSQAQDSLEDALHEAERRGINLGAAQASYQETAAGDSMLEKLEREFYHGVGHALKIFLDLNATRMDLSKLLSVIHWRVLGWPQAEVAKAVGLSLNTVQKYEKLLREHGVVFPRGKEHIPVSGYVVGKMLMQASKEQGKRGRLRRIK